MLDTALSNASNYGSLISSQLERVRITSDTAPACRLSLALFIHPLIRLYGILYQNIINTDDFAM